MKDRLIELIKQADTECANIKQCGNCIGFGKGEDCINHLIAEHLLANGVIVPPCTIGTPLFFLNDSEIYEGSIIETTEWIYVYSDEGLIIEPLDVACFEHSYDYIFGKTVFLTKEEAEKALAERSEGE